MTLSFSRAVALGMLALAAGCQCGTRPVPDQANSAFVMERDSLPFPNFTQGYEASALDEAGLQRMFGDGVCVAGSSPCQLTASARTFMEEANTSMSGGRCEGFAVLSDLMAAGKVDVSTFGATSARALTLDENPALQRELAYWFATQLVPDAVAAKTKGYMAKDVLPVLADSFEEGATEHYRIGIVQKKGKSLSGGHSLTPIGFFRDPSAAGVYWLRVYDNNHPDVERLMKLDVVKNRWEFEASADPAAPSRLYVGDPTNNNPLYLAPVFSRQGVLPCPFCGEEGGAQITTSGGAQPSISTPDGEVGVSEGELLAAAGTSVTPSFSDAADSEAASFVIGLGRAARAGMGGQVVIKMTAPPDPLNPEAQQTVGYLDPRVSTQVRGLRVTAADTFTATAQGGTYANASRTPLELTTRLDTGMGLLTVTAYVTGGSDSVSAHVDPATGKLTLSLTGAQGTPIAVSVQGTTMGGVARSAQFFVTGTGAVVLEAETTGWMQGGTLSGTLTNDGTTSSVSNACFDQQRTGRESDVDCGAACGVGCLLGQACGVDGDCASGLCHPVRGVCIADACGDGRQSAGETGVDCGGPCAPCAVGLGCSDSTDCAQPDLNDCVSGTCRRVFTVGAAVSLPADVGGPGTALVLANGGDTLTVSNSGTYRFPTRTTGAYAVTVTAQPALAECSVVNGAGTATADVSVSVTCVRRFAIGGFVSGLPAGETVRLRNNGGSDLDVSQDGPFVFPLQAPGAYDVTVATQPASATCTVRNGAGPTPTADVSDVTVTCVGAPTYTIGGALSGLGAGKSLTLENNGEQLVLSANGTFTFPTAVTGAYAVTIASQPMGQTCAVQNGSGTATANVTTVLVVCPGTQGRDATFGTNGFLRVALTADADAWNALVVNADQSVVLAGSSEQAAGSTQWVVSKVTSDGALDPSFGVNGHRLITAGTGAEEARALARDSLGRYLVAGTLQGTSSLDLGVARLTAAGALDATFGTNGVARFDLGGDEQAGGVAVDSQGRVVVVGRQGGVIGGELLVARLTSAGALDATFATNGVYLPSTTASDALNAVVIGAGDVVYAAGASDQDSLVLKLTAAGAPDGAFGTAGQAVVDLTTGLNSDQLTALVLDGTRLVVAGVGSDASATNYVLAAFTAAGALDTSFGAGGILVVGGATPAEALHALAPRPGGGWYATGRSDSSAAVLAITASGNQDASFASGEFLDTFSGTATALAAGVDASGRLVIAGSFTAGGGSGDLGIARINP